MPTPAELTAILMALPLTVGSYEHEQCPSVDVQYFLEVAEVEAAKRQPFIETFDLNEVLSRNAMKPFQCCTLEPNHNHAQ